MSISWARLAARVTMAVVFSVALAACGGGGGGSGGGSGNTGSLTLSRSTIDFVTNDPTQTPPAQVVSATISPAVQGNLFLRIVIQGPAASGVTNVVVTSETTGQATIVPASASSLGPGRHTATITVTACTSDINCASGVIGTPQTIQVTYVVNGATSSAADVSFRVPLNAVAADYTRTLSITAHPTYTIATNQPWLSVTPNSGNSGVANLTLNLTPATVDALPSGDNAAEVVVTTPGNTLRIPVTVTNAKPRLDHVAPYVARANVADTVVLRGLFLDQLTTSSIDFLPEAGGSALAPSSVQVVSASELRVAHPALSAGAYLVRMRTAQGTVIDRSTARLVVANDIPFAATVLPYPDANRRRVNGLVYDAERQALVLSTNLIVNNTISFANDELLRYTYNTSWSGAAPGGLRPQLSQLALSTDGRNLVTSTVAGSSTEAGRLELLSPLGAGLGIQVAARGNGLTFSSLAATSTGEVLAMEGSNFNTGVGFRITLYQPRNNTLRELSIAPVSDLSQGATVATSGDGLRGVLFGNLNNQSSVYEFNSSTGVLSRSSFTSSARSISLDRTGNRVAAANASEAVRVYDRNWNLLGTLPASTVAFVLTPSGNRAITFDSNRQVRQFDLTAAPVGGAFPEIGTGITPAADPVTVAAEPVRLALTPDGRTLFVAADTRVVVVPLP